MGKQHTREEWIKKFIKQHGTEHYDYNKCILPKNSHDDGVFYCNSLDENGIPHGYFKQSPHKHAQGQGCKLCAIERNRQMRKIKSLLKNKTKKVKKETTNKNKKSINKNNSNNIPKKKDKNKEKYCKVCGNKLSKKGICENCKAIKLKEEIINRIEKYYKNEIEPINIDIIDQNSIIELYCHRKYAYGAEHGYFKIKVKNFLKMKEVCNECSSRKEYNNMPEETFIKLAQEKYKELIDLSGINYNNAYSTINVKINGKEHNLTPAAILKRKYQYGKVPYNKWTPETFYNKMVDIYKDKNYTYEYYNYKGYDEELFINCHELDEDGNEHGVFKITPKLIIRGLGCRKCSKKKQWDTESFIKAAKKIFGDRNDYYKGGDEYKSMREPFTVYCNKHKYFYSIPPKEHLKGHGCPLCNESHLEREVRNLLTYNKINFIPQANSKIFKWLKTSKTASLSFDFYLNEYNIAIECQGSQHFKPSGFGGIDKEKSLLNFNKTIFRDKRKRQLCKDNNVELIYFLDKQYEKYMNPDEDIYFTDKEDLVRYILSKPKMIEEGKEDETSDKE